MRGVERSRSYVEIARAAPRVVRAVPILIPLLRDEEIKEVVPWSLGEIGDKSAIPPLALIKKAAGKL